MSCKKCGACCRYVALGYLDGSKPMVEDSKKWYGYHGAVQNEYGMLFIPCKCEKLQENNECSIYDNRPYGCQMLPMSNVREFQPPQCLFFKPDDGELEAVDVRSMVGQHVKTNQV